MTRDDKRRDGGDQQSRFEYDIGHDEAPSTAVVTAVSAITGSEIAAIDPLYEIIDPDALDELIAGSNADEISVNLHFHGCDIRITPDRIALIHSE